MAKPTSVKLEYRGGEIHSSLSLEGQPACPEWGEVLDGLEIFEKRPEGGGSLIKASLLLSQTFMMLMFFFTKGTN